MYEVYEAYMKERGKALAGKGGRRRAQLQPFDPCDLLYHLYCKLKEEYYGVQIDELYR